MFQILYKYWKCAYNIAQLCPSNSEATASIQADRHKITQAHQDEKKNGARERERGREGI